MNNPPPLPDRDTTCLDPADLLRPEQYKLMTGTVIPRPIALITTLGPNGHNAAPFSFFNAVSICPPTIMASIGPRNDELKDTIRNLRILPEFVVHIVDFASAEKMNICAIDFPSQVNEIERAGFRTAPSLKVQPLRLIDCPVQMECRLMDVREVGTLPHHMIMGEVVMFHYHKGIVNQRLHVDAAAIDAIGRLAGELNYIRTDNRFGMPMLPVPDA